MTGPEHLPVHHVMWTGGWDSTFRVCELLLVHGRSVQPWYVVDPERRTTGRERSAMARVAAAIGHRDPAARARLRPPVVRHAPDLVPDGQLARDVATLGARVPVYSQHSWMAELARREMPGTPGPLETGANDLATTPTFDGLRLVQAPGAAPDDWWHLASTGNPQDALAVFGAFRLPLLALTKADMEQRARDGGFLDLLDLTWFCRWPTVLGNACGQCTPCEATRDGGLGRRVPRDSVLRRRLHTSRWAWVRRAEAARIRAAAVRRRLGA